MDPACADALARESLDSRHGGGAASAGRLGNAPGTGGCPSRPRTRPASRPGRSPFGSGPGDRRGGASAGSPGVDSDSRPPARLLRGLRDRLGDRLWDCSFEIALEIAFEWPRLGRTRRFPFPEPAALARGCNGCSESAGRRRRRLGDWTCSGHANLKSAAASAALHRPPPDDPSRRRLSSATGLGQTRMDLNRI